MLISGRILRGTWHNSWKLKSCSYIKGFESGSYIKEGFENGSFASGHSVVINGKPQTIATSK
jgi:hypothetical protein